jgi:hypothetical protein
VAAQAAQHRVGVPMRGAQGEADEVEVGRGHGAHRRPVVVVVPRREQLGGVDGDRHAAAQRALLAGGELVRARLEHKHRLAQHRQVPHAVGVDVVLAHHGGAGGGGHAAHQERRDVQALPDGKVVADDDRDLGVEIGDGHRPER